MVRLLPAALAVLPIALAADSQKGSVAPTPNAAIAKSVQPFVRKYCIRCHTGDSPPGGFSASASNARSIFNSVAKWRSAAGQAEKGTMPPKGAPAPTQAERAAFAKAVRTVADLAPKTPADPGRVVLRRLNRVEYDNTIRDLFFGMPFSPAADFPSDDVGYGFDNIGDVLTLSPLLVEKYFDAADAIVQKAIVIPKKNSFRFDVEALDSDTGRAAENSAVLFANGRVWADAPKLSPGPYRVRIHAFAQQAGPEVAKMEVFLNRRRAGAFEVRAEGQAAVYELPGEMLEGDVRIAAAFVNDYYNPQDPNPRQRDRNLHIVAIELLGTSDDTAVLPMAHQKIVFRRPDGVDPLPAARAVLGEFARRAFRRPPAKDEVERLANLVGRAMKDGEPYERGIQIALTAVLVSPHFLFRVEPSIGVGVSARNLNGHEIATRLSYFLWSTMPDEGLFSAAKSGELARPQALMAQIDRMLRDPKASALSENFASQWLNLRKLEGASPDPQLFPEFDDALRESMRKETELYFAHIVQQDRPVGELIDSSYTFVNGPLAKLYGLSGIEGPAFRRVALADRRRGGILTHASVLTVTSNPNRTSPVKRGKWVLEQILGAAPPPPPPNVGVLEGDTDRVPLKTIKERMARHRRDPSCSVCHRKMDGIGLAFENYDAIGRWRTQDGAFPVETEGQWDSGERFRNAIELRALLLKRRPQFVRAFTEKLATYALGRGMGPSDGNAIESIAAEASRKGEKFSSIVKGIVASDLFLKRKLERGER